MKKISSGTICTYFYVVFFVVAAAAGVVVLADLVVVAQSGGRRGWMLLLRSLIALALPLLNALFMYLLCSRSLLDGR